MAKKNRANGEGTLEKRGKYYLARWTFQGKHYSKSTKCTEKKEAEKVLAELVKPFQTGNTVDALAFVKAKLESQIQPDETKDPPTKITLMYDKYVDDISLSNIGDSTYRSYISKLNQLEKYAKAHNIEYAHQFTKKNAEELLVEVRKRKTDSSYNAYLKIYKMIFKGVMKKDKNIKYNPFSEFNALREDKSKKRREFTDEELVRLHKVLEDETVETKIFFMLGEYCGMRISDASNCKWVDIDFRSKMIRYLPIKTSKNGVKAIVPIHNELNKLLITQLNSKADLEYVCPTYHSLYDKRKIYDLCNEIFEKAEIKICKYDKKTSRNHIETGYHSLRRTFASKCSKDGIPLADIQTMLGHSTPMMSLEYVRTKESNLYLPEFNDKLTQVKIKTSTYNKIISLQQNNETFEDCLERVLMHGTIDWDKIKKDEEERKKKEAEEIENLISEVWGEDFIKKEA